jgi:CBS domain-containing protein
MKAGQAMTREVHTVSPDATAAEAALLMRSTGHGALPVVDSEGHLLGLVTRTALVRRCLPEYLEQVGDLYRSGEFRPFQDKAEEVGLLAVRDVMQSELLTVSEETPLAEVASLMIMHHVRQIPVLKDGRLVGIVGMQDIVDKIAWPEPEEDRDS